MNLYLAHFLIACGIIIILTVNLIGETQINEAAKPLKLAQLLELTK